MKPAFAALMGRAAYAQPGATHFNGVDQYGARATNFTGLVDGKRGTVSGWSKMSATALAVADQYWLCNYFQFFQVEINDDTNGPIFSVVGYAADGSTVVISMVGNRVARDGEFHHYFASWDLAAGVGAVWIDGANQTYHDGGYPLLVNTDIAYNAPGATGPAFWANQGYVDDTGNVVVAGSDNCLAEQFFQPDYLPPTPENIRKFRTADGRPANLGYYGQRVFGTRPLYYDPEGNGQNRGYGGILTPVGAPTRCGSHP